MREQIEVVFENGVLRPVVPLTGHFQEREHLTITIENTKSAAHWLTDADPSISLESVRHALAKIPGSLAQEVIADRADR